MREAPTHYQAKVWETQTISMKGRGGGSTSLNYCLHFKTSYSYLSSCVLGGINIVFLFSRDAVFNHFISRVRNNLHVVLCMSPVGDAFRTRCRMFPSLVNCCTIDWFTEWPRSVEWCLHKGLDDVPKRWPVVESCNLFLSLQRSAAVRVAELFRGD